jgi:p-methyltransferase
MPNLAAAYLTNYLRTKGFAAEYVNLFQQEKQHLTDYLEQDPLCVAITTTFYVINLPVTEMVEFIRSINPRVKIVVGGPLISNHVRNLKGDNLKMALQDIGADYYVVDSQGEATLAQLTGCLKAGADIEQVANLIYFSHGELRETPIIPERNSLEENYINWETFRDKDLGHTIQLRTARSCAFSCSFCNYPTRAGKLTLADLGTVEKELDSIRGLGSVENVVFIDDTFNVPLPRFKELCRLMIRKKYNFNWFSYFRCSNSDLEAFDLMAESGCKGVFLGIESGSPTILKNMNKAATVEKYVDGISHLRARKILTFGSFIVGFPGETDETIEETIAFIRNTRPDYYRAQNWYCEPGTPIERQRDKYGIVGEGFEWKHNTMTNLEALDHIDRMFLTIHESLWLPQWSFDFWFIPYFMGMGISLDDFHSFVASAYKMLAMDIAYVPENEKRKLQAGHLQNMRLMVQRWFPLKQRRLPNSMAATSVVSV